MSMLCSKVARKIGALKRCRRLLVFPTLNNLTTTTTTTSDSDLEHFLSYRDRHPSVIYFNHCSRKTVAEPVGCTLPVFVDMANSTSSAPPGSGIVFSLHFSTKVCVYPERIDNLCARALRGLLLEAVVFPSFCNLRKVLLAIIFFCPVTRQSDPNVFGMPSLFSKAISH